MASYGYSCPPEYQHPGSSSRTYTPQQPAQLQTQQRQQSPRQAPQPAAFPGTSYYPSPDPSISPSSTSSSPTAHPTQPQRRPSSSKDPQWLCMYPAHAGVAFQRKADLQRHYDHVHNSAAVALWDCPQPGCHRKGGMGFGRKDKLVEHLREVHKRDIPKRGGGGGR